MRWDIIKIKNDKGEEVTAQAPVIISASRSTDIPTFYMDWFIERWKRGFVCWTNPFNNVPLYVSFKNTRLVVFWTKNPKPMFKHLDFLDEHVRNYYFHFSLNDYDKEKLEGKVPNVNNRIASFIKLSERLGKDRVIWRYDPLFLTDAIDVQELLKRLERVGDQLKDYTSKLVFSYADIGIYPKVERNLKREGINFREFTQETMEEFATGLRQLNEKWGLEIATCSEKIDLDKFGISHNKCIDDDLIIKLYHQDKQLMDFLGVEVQELTLFDDHIVTKKGKFLKDKGQRENCGCIVSKDIGQYNTCPHECVYCYANNSKETALKNYKAHLRNPVSERIIEN